MIGSQVPAHPHQASSIITTCTLQQHHTATPPLHYNAHPNNFDTPRRRQTYYYFVTATLRRLRTATSCRPHPRLRYRRETIFFLSCKNAHITYAEHRTAVLITYLVKTAFFRNERKNLSYHVCSVEQGLCSEANPAHCAVLASTFATACPPALLPIATRAA